MPWYKVTPEKPTGHYDKICVNAYSVGGFEDEHGDLRKYEQKIDDQPQINGPFLACRVMCG